VPVGWGVLRILVLKTEAGSLGSARMTDLASRSDVEVRARARKPNVRRDATRLVVLVAAVAALVYLIGAFTGHSGAVTQITNDAKANFSAQTVSCHKTSPEPGLTSEAIYACKIAGVARSFRPNAHVNEASFGRCFIRTAGGQTVDVSRAVSVLSQDRGKTAPCS
jgi:hypothetical protein